MKMKYYILLIFLSTGFCLADETIPTPDPKYVFKEFCDKSFKYKVLEKSYVDLDVIKYMVLNNSPLGIHVDSNNNQYEPTSDMNLFESIKNDSQIKIEDLNACSQVVVASKEGLNSPVEEVTVAVDNKDEEINFKELNLCAVDIYQEIVNDEFLKNNSNMKKPKDYEVLLKAKMDSTRFNNDYSYTLCSKFMGQLRLKTAGMQSLDELKILKAIITREAKESDVNYILSIASLLFGDSPQAKLDYDLNWVISLKHVLVSAILYPDKSLPTLKELKVLFDETIQMEKSKKIALNKAGPGVEAVLVEKNFSAVMKKYKQGLLYVQSKIK